MKSSLGFLSFITYAALQSDWRAEAQVCADYLGCDACVADTASSCVWCGITVPSADNPDLDTTLGFCTDTACPVLIPDEYVAAASAFQPIGNTGDPSIVEILTPVGCPSPLFEIGSVLPELDCVNCNLDPLGAWCYARPIASPDPQRTSTGGGFCLPLGSIDACTSDVMPDYALSFPGHLINIEVPDDCCISYPTCLSCDPVNCSWCRLEAWDGISAAPTGYGLCAVICPLLAPEGLTKMLTGVTTIPSFSWQVNPIIQPLGCEAQDIVASDAWTLTETQCKQTALKNTFWCAMTGLIRTDIDRTTPLKAGGMCVEFTSSSACRQHWQVFTSATTGFEIDGRPTSNV